MPLPRTLRELQLRAERLFGGSGRLRIFRRGGEAIKDSRQLADLHDGDVVVVTWDDRRLCDAEIAGLMTTHQAHYVEHHVPRQPLLGPRLPAVPTPSPAKFDDRTAYKGAYVWHPPSTRQPLGRPDIALKQSNGCVGRSTYALTFLGLPAQRAEAWPDDPRRGSWQGNGARLEGTTSYMRDFPPHDPQEPPGLLKHADNMLPVGGIAFEAGTTYEAHFGDIAPPKPRTPFRPPDWQPQQGAFQGATEYQDKYLSRSREGALGPVLHIEPAADLGRPK